MEKFVKEYNLRTYECDKNGYIRIVTLFNILQDMADSHASDLGLGMEYCLSKGFAWVGANYHVKINRMPKTHEYIKIERAYCYRIDKITGEIVSVSIVE